MTIETRDEEIPTGHGETVTVTVVDCCSCEQTVPLESTALAVVMDENEYDNDYRSFSKYKSSRGKHEEGRLCENCRNNPIKWPMRQWLNGEVQALGFFILGLFLGGMFFYSVMAGI